MQPEIQAIIEGLFDLGADIKKGLKAGGVLAAVMADADLIAKLEVVAANLSKVGADVKALSAADIVPLVQASVQGVEKILAA